MEGNWRPGHLFELRQALELVEFYQKQIAACDHEIEGQLTRFEDKSAGHLLSAAPRQRKARRTEPGFDARQQELGYKLIKNEDFLPAASSPA